MTTDFEIRRKSLSVLEKDIKGKFIKCIQTSFCPNKVFLVTEIQQLAKS